MSCKNYNRVDSITTNIKLSNAKYFFLQPAPLELFDIKWAFEPTLPPPNHRFLSNLNFSHFFLILTRSFLSFKLYHIFFKGWLQSELFCFLRFIYRTYKYTNTFKFLKIKAIEATLPNEDYILRWERLSKRGRYLKGTTWYVPFFED